MPLDLKLRGSLISLMSRILPHWLTGAYLVEEAVDVSFDGFERERSDDHGVVLSPRLLFFSPRIFDPLFQVCDVVLPALFEGLVDQVALQDDWHWLRLLARVFSFPRGWRFALFLGSAGTALLLFFFFLLGLVLLLLFGGLSALLLGLALSFQLLIRSRSRATMSN